MNKLVTTQEILLMLGPTMLLFLVMGIGFGIVHWLEVSGRIRREW